MAREEADDAGKEAWKREILLAQDTKTCYDSPVCKER